MSIRQETIIREDELLQQFVNMERVRSLGGGKYHVVTYGCQMNVRDSQTLSGMFEKMGYEQTPSREEADVILFNTCCIRENAERRLFGNVSRLGMVKRKKKNLIIGVCGCMMQQDEGAERLLKASPFVNIVFGTHNLHRFPEFMLQALEEKTRVVDVESDPFGYIVEGLPVKLESDAQASVNIMYGCNNFCSYCIVPFVRGRERSRDEADIIKEVESLAQKGIKEITLLGQNVNSYAPKSGDKFPALLRALDGIVPRIRFMTSHPKDLSDALIEVMATSKSVCPQLHLPVQSGSNRVLSRMNRGYTREQYLQNVEKLRAAIPNIGLTTDFIAGFPGESNGDFGETLALSQAVGFDSAFTFIFSPRAGTKAAEMPDQIPEDVQHERLSRLIAQQEEITIQRLQMQLDTEQSVLIENVSTRDEGQYMGRTDTGFMVNLPREGLNIGDIVPIKIVSHSANTLKGEKI